MYRELYHQINDIPGSTEEAMVSILDHNPYKAYSIDLEGNITESDQKKLPVEMFYRDEHEDKIEELCKTLLLGAKLAHPKARPIMLRDVSERVGFIIAL